MHWMEGVPLRAADGELGAGGAAAADGAVVGNEWALVCVFFGGTKKTRFFERKLLFQRKRLFATKMSV